jgi:hypothetical protein
LASGLGLLLGTYVWPNRSTADQSSQCTSPATE